MDRHDLSERSKWAVANAFHEIESARMRLGRRLGAHPAFYLFRIGQEGQKVAGEAAIWVS